jgi:hypothetical protein
MKFSDIFRIKTIIEERDQLKAANAELAALTENLKSKYREVVVEANNLRSRAFADDKKEYMELNKQIEAKKAELASLLSNCQRAQDTVLQLDSMIAASEERLVYLDDIKEAERHGLFVPQYKFGNLRSYKTKMTEVRREQKAMIKDGTALKVGQAPLLNNSEKNGLRLFDSMQTLALRAFNVECDDVIKSATPETHEAAVKRINIANDTINKLCRVLSIAISEDYVALKQQELALMCEYQTRKAQKAKKDN